MHPSIHPLIIFFNLTIHLFIDHPSICICISVYLCVSVCQFLDTSICISVTLVVCFFHSLVFRQIHPSVHPSIDITLISAEIQAFQPLLHPMVTPETLPMHPIRELQERCQQQAEGLEYKATRTGNIATVQVFVNGVAMATAQNPQKKMAQKLAARNALEALKEKETKNCTKVSATKAPGQAYTRQTLNDLCLRRQWPMPQYRCVKEGGPAHAKRFVYAVRVNTSDSGWTDECIGEPMPSVKKAKDSAAALLLEVLNNKHHPPASV